MDKSKPRVSNWISAEEEIVPVLNGLNLNTRIPAESGLSELQERLEELVQEVYERGYNAGSRETKRTLRQFLEIEP